MLENLMDPEGLSTLSQQKIDALRLQIDQERMEISSANRDTKALTEELVIYMQIGLYLSS